MNPLNSVTEFAFNSAFVFVVLLQIFLPSYFGSEVTMNLGNLRNSIYHSNWRKQSLSYQRNVIIFMEYLKKVYTIKAFHLMPMTRESFVWV